MQARKLALAAGFSIMTALPLFSGAAWACCTGRWPASAARPR